MSLEKQKVAVAIVHGIGNQESDFADPFTKKLIQYFARELKGHVEHPEQQLVVRSVYWAPHVEAIEDELRARMAKGGPLDWKDLRNFMTSFAGDAIAYQPVGKEKETYDKVHRVFAQTLETLSYEAGEKAPLAVVAHSLGTAISSNFLYDLQILPRKDVLAPMVKEVMTDTPLERGETLTHLYTLGSPLALWSMRYMDYGTPITVPSPLLSAHYPGLGGEWVNIYDEDDVIGYPLKTLNAHYGQMVTEDWQVNVGRLFSFWNPLSHTHYFESRRIAKRIAVSLAQTWKEVNQAPAELPEIVLDMKSSFEEALPVP
jgi:hypothetical protein